MKAAHWRCCFPLLGLFAQLIVGVANTFAKDDALDHWTQAPAVPNPFGTNGQFSGFGFGGAAYGNDRFVAIGAPFDDRGVIQSSEDGLTWTMRSPLDFSILNITKVTFANGTFVVVGWAGGAYHSTNGIDWFAHPAGVFKLYAVTYGNGLFVAVGDAHDMMGAPSTTWSNICTSPDGITWTPRFSGPISSSQSGITDIAFGAGRFIAVQPGRTFYKSTNGIDWSYALGPDSSRINFCKDKFFVPLGVGSNAVSSDGLSWSAVFNNTGVAFGRIIYADGIYLATSEEKIFTSTNGIDWTQRNTQISTNGFDSFSIGNPTYGKGRFVGVGYIRLTSTSGLIPRVYVSDPIVGTGMAPVLPPAVKVSGVVGRSYRIDYLEDLQSTNWQTATNFVLTNSPTIWTDTLATNASRFYRAVLLP